jgi:hypothetical protein
MKIIPILLILGTIIKHLIALPTASLPEYPVRGTVKMVEKQEVSDRPAEYRHLSRKMYYLKTGRCVASERNYKKQQNFWGKGVPAAVAFPSHLAEWEQARRFGNGTVVAISK